MNKLIEWIKSWLKKSRNEKKTITDTIDNPRKAIDEIRHTEWCKLREMNDMLIEVDREMREVEQRKARLRQSLEIEINSLDQEIFLLRQKRARLVMESAEDFGIEVG